MKVDAVKLVKGKPVFADDVDLPGMLHAAMLTSPHAHARITRIDAVQSTCAARRACRAHL